DLIALTGDVINFGLAREFRASREWFESLASSEKLLVIPGNHEAMAGQWHQAMLDAWGPYAMALPRMTRYDSAGLALIQLSTAIATPVGLASGRLHDLDQSAALLSEARHAGHCPVVLMHHPPTSITSARRGLSNAADACHALADAALVLHGHTHRADLSYFDGAYGRIPVLGVPSFSMAPGARHPPGAWRMIEIDTVALRATVTEYAISTDGNVTPRTPFAIALPCPPPGDRPN
ncbi:MAG: metallophosphoesterase, partial [Pseudomonadota bacterium]